ncbi:hypothetical protein KCU64_g7553, partial [Aureobasidium melanogenum]
MAERNPKRQRISLGGPAADATFEDYLTGKTTEKSSEDEEEFDQENQDPGNELEEDEEYDEDEPEAQPAPSRAASTTSTTAAPITNPRDLVLRIHAHQNNTPSNSAKDIFYLVQVWSLFGKVPVEVTHERREIANIRDCGPGGMHNLGPDVGSSKDLDSKKVRLMDIWNATQAPEVRNLRMFFTYDCYGDPSWAQVTFMGVAAEGLQAADLGVKVKRNQAIWCAGGSGASVPVDVPEEELDEWIAETNKHEWKIDDVNKHLAEIKVKV